MKSYTLKSIGKNTDYMTIVREMEDGYVVKISANPVAYALTDLGKDFQIDN